MAAHDVMSLTSRPLTKSRPSIFIDVMRKIAKNHDATVAEIALAWVRLQVGVTSTIIGAKNMMQLESNISSVNLDLSDDELAELDEVSSTTRRYPFWMVDQQGMNRIPKPEEQ